MTEPEKHAGALLSALRDDLPSERDEARIRRKLVGAGVAVGTTVAASHWAHAAAASSVKAATTSSAPTAVALGGAATAGKATVLTTTWAGLTTGAKLALVSVAVAGGAYPAARHWTAPASHAALSQPSTTAVAASARAVEVPAFGTDARHVNTDARLTPTLDPAKPGAVSTTAAPTIAPTAAYAPAALTGAGKATATAHAQQPRLQSAGHDRSPRPNALADQRLREETVLIERALLAARTNDTIAAARWLGEHERRFPGGILARERERLRAALR